MLLKIATWYLNRTINKLPAGIGRIDYETNQVIWPANG